MFDNSYEEVQGGTFRQQRRSLPLDALVFDAFPDMYESVVSFVQTKLLVKKSEIRLGLVFRPHNLQKNQRMRDRIRKVIQQQRSMREALLDIDLGSQTEHLFVSDDEDDEDERLNKHLE